ncbi:MAG: DUF2760 domain-containing protein [Candidatus Pacebacteria bacterium]|nr:DUF2760 domain-containing protein [Candidatus Paceibacterota bacterium]
MRRFMTACKAFWKILFSGDLALAWEKPSRGEVTQAAPDAEHTEDAGILPDAVYTLVLLQREGRLIDFLKEDIDVYGDEQVGAAVRQIHTGCRKVLDDNFGVSPVDERGEGEPVDIPPGFDSGAIRLTGNVRGDPPFKGTLQHGGWKVTKVDFPERHAKLDPAIICPAEVEL